MFLTDNNLPQSKERLHGVDFGHECTVTEGEVGHDAARLSSCHHLEQSCKSRSYVGPALSLPLSLYREKKLSSTPPTEESMVVRVREENARIGGEGKRCGASLVL